MVQHPDSVHVGWSAKPLWLRGWANVLDQRGSLPQSDASVRLQRARRGDLAGNNRRQMQQNMAHWRAMLSQFSWIIWIFTLLLCESFSKENQLCKYLSFCAVFLARVAYLCGMLSCEWGCVDPGTCHRHWQRPRSGLPPALSSPRPCRACSSTNSKYYLSCYLKHYLSRTDATDVER